VTEEIRPETTTHAEPELDSGELATPSNDDVATQSAQPTGTGGDLAPTEPLPKGWDEAADLSKPPATVPDLAEIDVPAELQSEIEDLMSRYPDRHSAALPALAAAQRLHGWCSPEAVDQVAAVMRVTPAYLSSVATFYDMLNTEPVGRHYVWVCTSVACMPRNAKAVFESIKEAGADLDDVHIREFECLGACDMAPMASVDGRYVGPLQPGDAEQIVEALRRGEKPLPGRGLGD
jgi:NADH:ubiquinone oxidoreductase subunit E